MLPPTHLAVGYMFAKTYCDVFNLPCGSEPIFVAITIAGSLFPDIDIFFGKKINEHRNSIFHTPFLYFCLVCLFFLAGIFWEKMWIYMIAFAFGAFSHLFLDWVSGRTIGVRIFYPFSKTTYSLFPLTPQMGNITLVPNRKNLNAYTSWLRFFFRNRFLVICEILIFLIFLYSLFI